MPLKFLSKIFQKRAPSRGGAKKTPPAAVAGEKETGAEVETPGPRKEVGRHAAVFGVLLEPKVTEKTSAAARDRKYVFAVNPGANRIEIKKATEGRYGVEVTGVNVLHTPDKERKRGRQIGRKKGYKKAVVTLGEGQTIELT